MKRLWGFAFIALALVVCGGSQPDVCVPGQSVGCVGVGGCTGFQVCDAKGAAFEACVCGPVTDASAPKDVVVPPFDAGVDAGDGIAEATLLANAECGKRIACAGATSFANLATCVTRVKEQFLMIYALKGSSWTPALLAACANEVSTVSCAKWYEGANCYGLLGTLPNGSACGGGVQCASGACVTPGGCGTCQPAKGPGGSCTNGAECSYPLYCSGSQCKANSKAFEGCSSSQYCGYGLACSSYQCVPSSTGSYCDGSSDSCAVYYYCDDYYSCHPWQFAQPGGSCGWVNYDYSVWRDCGVGPIRCPLPSSTWTATCPLIAEDGQPCNNSTTYCNVYSYCSGGVCKRWDAGVCK